MTESTTEAVPSPPSTEAPPTISEYLLAMSHEIRAPLNAAIGMSALLLDGELSEKHRQYAKSIHAAGEGLAAILNDLIDLSRIAADRLPIEPIPFDLRSMVEETAGVLSPRAAERGLGLRVDWRPELPRHVIGDPGRARQVLGNLIGHAVNGTSQGEVVIRVLLGGERDGVKLIRFVVEDTGIGIMPERLGKVFESYVPVDASPYRSFGVTGLGLRLSADLVRRMGGTIGAESELGKGSRFWFVLPMATAAVSGALDLDRPKLGGRMLIVEPDPAAESRFRSQVESSGWAATFISDPAQLTDTLTAAHLAGAPFEACLISDYAVRPLHVELATRLKADQRLAKIALIMVTAVGSPGEGKKLWHAGFAAYLRKPVPNDEIQDTLAAIHQVGGDGRGAMLITRHSLAEVRNAQTFAPEGIDDLLASLQPAIDEPQASPAPIPAVVAQVPPVPPIPVFGAATWAVAPSPVSLDREPVVESAPVDRPPIAEPSAIVVDQTTSAMVIDEPSPEPAQLESAAGSVVTMPETASAQAIPIAEPVVEVAPGAVAAAQETVADPTPVVSSDNEVVGEIESVVDLVDVAEEQESPNLPPLETVEHLLTDPAATDIADVEGVEHDDEWAPPSAAVALVHGFDQPGLVSADELELEPLTEVLPPGAEIGETPVERGLEVTVEEPAAPPEDEIPVLELEESDIDLTPVTLSFPVMPPPPSEDLEPALLAESIIEETLPPAPPEIGSMIVVEPPSEPEPGPVAVEADAEVIEEVPALDVVSPEFADLVGRGGGFFVQYVVASCVRDVPIAIADLAAASTRADAGGINNATDAIRRAAGPVGAARLLDLIRQTEADIDAGRLDEAAGHIGTIEHAFLEVRNALDVASPTGLPTEVAAVGAAFLDQLSPARQGPAQALSIRLADSFATDGAARLAEMREAIVTGNADQAQRVAQTLKGMCGLINADSFGKLCALVEADARLRRVAQAERYLPFLDREFTRVLSALAKARS